MDVSIVELASIRPYERNPNLNNAAVDAVAKPLREFGFRQPIVVDAEGVIVCSHTRWKAAMKLGIPHVPVHVSSDPSLQQLRDYRIADNQTASIAVRDVEIPPIKLRDLRADRFDEDACVWILAPIEVAGQIDPEDVPKPPDEAMPPLAGGLNEARTFCAPPTKRGTEARNLGRTEVLCEEPP